MVSPGCLQNLSTESKEEKQIQHPQFPQSNVKKRVRMGDLVVISENLFQRDG